ncbi:HNH endonuclease [Aphanizomenon sp. UHCC 0183]|uniref:HNH endonuclease n=1 Tax=Aphanizomenon sp. UHCC 0183 TaxID=2590028 RepID=UPI001C2CA38B|nr:HNH endonuclease signature motif containing protein [Aphanizomenon sp. UHCC 0183]
MTNNAISFSLRQLVIERAQGRCEYCLIHQDFSIYTHEIDHIIAVKHGGQTLSENLALSCLPCNHSKRMFEKWYSVIFITLLPPLVPPCKGGKQ